MALIDIDKEPVAFARRGVVEKPLALRGVLRDEPTLETHPLLGIGRRRERLHPLPRLRRTGVVRLSAEGEFDVLERSDKTVSARPTRTTGILPVVVGYLTMIMNPLVT